jgi:hypothetical protein
MLANEQDVEVLECLLEQPGVDVIAPHRRSVA